MTDSKAPEDALQQLADHLMAIDELVHTPEIAAQIGPGIEREISYAVSGFRQRFPERFDPQRSLL